MSNRTIIELNHDYAGDIDRDPEGFIQAIRNLLNSGVNKDKSREREGLLRFGIRTSPTHHHSTQAEVVLTTEGGTEFFRQRFS